MTRRRPGVRVRSYLAATRLLDGVLALLHAAFAGFWLGLLKHGDFQDLDAEYYRRQSMYRDDSYNRSGFFLWEKQAVERYFSTCRRVVVTAAGGGREMLALCRMGCVADGFECNSALVANANRLLAEEGCDATVSLCERDVCPPLARRYDGAIVGWSSFMLIPGRQRRVRFLQELRQALDPGAPILLSFCPLDAPRRRLNLTAAFGNVIRRLRRSELLDPGDDLSPNYVHRFTRGEIAETLTAAGFQLAHFETVDYGRAVGVASLAGVADCEYEVARP